MTSQNRFVSRFSAAYAFTVAWQPNESARKPDTAESDAAHSSSRGNFRFAVYTLKQVNTAAHARKIHARDGAWRKKTAKRTGSRMKLRARWKKMASARPSKELRKRAICDNKLPAGVSRKNPLALPR